MTERGLSARTIHYAHVLIKSAMQQAVRWRLLQESGRWAQSTAASSKRNAVSDR